MATASSRFSGPPLGQDIPALGVAEFIRQRARLQSHKTALLDARTLARCTYAELDDLVGRFAVGLTATGFAPGDVLLMFAPNGIEWPVAALGAMAAGGVVSGANPSYGAQDLAHQIRDSQASYVFTVPALLPTVQAALAMVPCKGVIVVGEEPQTTSYASLISSPPSSGQGPVDCDAIAALPYSSGTTGVSKGVMLTHRNLVSNIMQILYPLQFEHDEPILTFLPMFHIYGFTILTLAILAWGGTVITMAKFEPEPFLQAIATHRIRRLYVVPPIVQFLAKHPLVNQYDLSCVASIGSGAAPLGAEVTALAAQRFGCEVTQGFGMTEASGVVAVSYPGRVRAGSSGQLLPLTEGRIVDWETKQDVPVGASGEFWFRGPQAFQGYLNQPASTQATITSDGWVRTGDIGHFDEDGFLFITDRLKELIKVKGFQVAPAELEALLFTHPAVSDVAVIGRADERAGELPVAYVVARAPLEIDELKAWVAQRVIAYKQLGDVVLCDAIPKTASGKILRRVLRQQDLARDASA